MLDYDAGVRGRPTLQDGHGAEEEGDDARREDELVSTNLEVKHHVSGDAIDARCATHHGYHTASRTRELDAAQKLEPLGDDGAEHASLMGRVQ